ncbi:pilus assembly PilX N-terminal domain-containing protein [Neobacillus sp. LXY-4]|uniref:pilus assembly PilX N-terminal domain-containing protein n=1 Tax=Neobacillus sp. LXY-4 TaxID=3379826 RepID=UPI003EE3AAEC
MQKWFLKVNNERGIALVAVLLAFVVISILGLAVMGLSVNNIKMTSTERNYQSSYYIAESGITYKINDISSRIASVYGQSLSASDFFSRVEGLMELGQEKVIENYFEESFGSKPVVKIKIEKLPNDSVVSYSNKYKITSKGIINNRTRKVTKIIYLTWKPKSGVTIPAGTVLFVKENLTLKNVPVDGSIGTNGSLTEVTLNGSKAIVTGNVYTNVGTPLPIPEFPIFSAPTNGVNYTSNSLVMEQDMVFNSLTVGANQTLKIDVGYINKNIVVNNLNLASGAKIEIIGSGKLAIYAKNITMASGSILNTGGDIEKVYIFLEGTASNIAGLIQGSMFAKDANLVVNNYVSGVQGHIITAGTSISITGAGTANLPKMIYAPNAVVNVNASFSGSIIAKTLSSSGNDDNFIFKFVQINYDNSPLFVDNGSGLTPVRDMIIGEPVREN